MPDEKLDFRVLQGQDNERKFLGGKQYHWGNYLRRLVLPDQRAVRSLIRELRTGIKAGKATELADHFALAVVYVIDKIGAAIRAFNDVIDIFIVVAVANDLTTIALQIIRHVGYPIGDFSVITFPDIAFRYRVIFTVEGGDQCKEHQQEGDTFGFHRCLSCLDTGVDAKVGRL